MGRQYEPIIRINSQSGKGGAAFVMQNTFGYHLPKAMHPEFGALVKAACDKAGRELSAQELFEVFRHNYLEVPPVYALVRHATSEQSGEGGSRVHFHGTIRRGEQTFTVDGDGNGPLDAFFCAVSELAPGYTFQSYHEHAISGGSDSKAIAYIELKKPDGKSIFGVGIENNINLASMQGVLCALNRAQMG